MGGSVVKKFELGYMVVLLYPDISNFTFQNVKILKCKIFLINFLDELGNFKQKCNFFLHFKATDPMTMMHKQVLFKLSVANAKGLYTSCLCSIFIEKCLLEMK